MFGIKTKKDRQIELLESANETLRENLARAYFKQPKIITTQGNVVAFAAGQELEEGMSADYAKRMIAEKLVKNMARFK